MAILACLAQGCFMGIKSASDVAHPLLTLAWRITISPMQVDNVVTSPIEAMVLSRKPIYCAVWNQTLPPGEGVQASYILSLIHEWEEGEDGEGDQTGRYCSRCCGEKRLIQKAKLSVYQAIFLPTYSHLWSMGHDRKHMVTGTSGRD